MSKNVRNFLVKVFSSLGLRIKDLTISKSNIKRIITQESGKMKKRGNKSALIQGLSTILAEEPSSEVAYIECELGEDKDCVAITYWDGTSETLDITDNDCGQIGLKIFEEVYG